jgi:hypothetical protein
MVSVAAFIDVDMLIPDSVPAIIVLNETVVFPYTGRTINVIVPRGANDETPVPLNSPTFNNPSVASFLKAAPQDGAGSNN